MKNNSKSNQDVKKSSEGDLHENGNNREVVSKKEQFLYAWMQKIMGMERNGKDEDEKRG